MLAKPSVSVLGADPAHRRCILNGNAFQQDAITTFNGWQYAAFYGNLGPGAPPEPLYVHLARRKLPYGQWNTLVFGDYPQTVDDGHNTVQLGICPGDGTIHLSYDHHCDVLRYRRSIRKVASFPAQFAWTPALFTPTLDYFPGLPPTHKLFGYVTYPRFGAMGDDNMFCSFRDGKAGLGNDHLYIYHGGSTGLFTFAGTPLTGIRSNPYVHGIDYRAGRLHVTWVYRGFVNYDGWDDPLDTKHKQQAGPNSAANNHDICYAYSDDQGYTWNNGSGKVVADLKDGGTIDNKSEGIVAFRIPKGSGLMNQEAQAVDHDGGVHVLNRDTLDGGTYLWKHYYRSPEGTWRQQGIQPIDGTRRGRLAISKNGDLFLILPETTTPRIRILKATKASGYSHYEKVWEGHGYTGEPLVDTARLEHDNVLSVFVRADVDGATDKKNVVVLDFRL
ncbi:hypothetical protein B0T26DRAFT_691320 [Lasiosphaeria miniovina]|uniref:Dockerin type 1 n=1 Tax=Lasiosphaeria miniovina TaxID=1954250 RepID=A0AA40BJA5_9PEZI|nr:uncharacterized protein B0T26DRAFT_691320 [Lasiosphaeria miniovina]KAK0735264.1 hypothetical protein B0T26DRAFT_691320 [Lasiosphaeria miniovina]